MNNRRIAAVVDELVASYIAAHPTELEINDPSVSVSESSMIQARYRVQYIKRYQNLKEQYKRKFTSTDQVLKSLLTEIQKQIRAIDDELNQTNDTAKQAGLKKEKWVLEVAVRALTESRTLAWASQLDNQQHHELYEGSVDLRELLAYYWLAASDPDMEFSSGVMRLINEDIEVMRAREGGQFNEAAAREQLRKQYIQSSISNFIGVLHEIRRAHNEGALEFSMDIDNPSCANGTFGRIILKAGNFNALTAIEPLPPRMIQHEIHQFIVLQLRNSTPDVLGAVYRYIDCKLNFEEPAQADIDKFNGFIATLNGAQRELMAHLNSNIAKLNIGPRDVTTQAKIMQIMRYELEGLKQESLDIFPNQDLTDQLYKMCEQQQEKQSKEYKERIGRDPRVAQLRRTVAELFIRVTEFDRMVNNEIVRSLLVPSYMDGGMAQFKRQDFAERLQNEYQLQLKALKQLEGQCQTLIDAIQDPGVRGKVREALLGRKEKVEKLIANLQKKVSHLTGLKEDKEHVHSEALESLVLPLPGIKSIENKEATVYSQSQPAQWAASFLRVAFDRYPDGSLVSDDHEIDRLFQIMKRKFIETGAGWGEHYRDFMQQVIKETNLQFEQYHEPKTQQFWKMKTKACAFLAQAFNKNDADNRNDKTSDELRSLYRHPNFNLKLNNPYEAISQEEFSQRFLMEFETEAKAVNEVVDSCMTSSLSETEEARLWKNQACAMMGCGEDKEMKLLTDPNDQRIAKLHLFLVNTLFKALDLTEIRKKDWDALYWLCQCYMTCGEGTDQQGSRYTAYKDHVSASDTIEKRMKFLSAHVFTLIKTLKPVKTLFNIGYVRIMSYDAASLAMHSQVSDAEFFRVSNSQPDQLVRVKRKGMELKQDLVAKGASLSEVTASQAGQAKSKFIMGLIPFGDAIKPETQQEISKASAQNSEFSRSKYVAYSGQPLPASAAIAKAQRAVMYEPYKPGVITRAQSQLNLGNIPQEDKSLQDSTPASVSEHKSPALQEFARKHLETFFKSQQAATQEPIQPPIQPQQHEEKKRAPTPTEGIHSPETSVNQISTARTKADWPGSSSDSDSEPDEAQVSQASSSRSSPSNTDYKNACHQLRELTEEYKKHLEKEKEKRIDYIKYKEHLTIFTDPEIQKIERKLRIVGELLDIVSQSNNKNYKKTFDDFSDAINKPGVYQKLIVHRTPKASRYLLMASIIGIPIAALYSYHKHGKFSFWKSEGSRKVDEMKKVINKPR